MRLSVPFLVLLLLLSGSDSASAQLEPARPHIGTQQPAPLLLRSPVRAAVTPTGELLVTDYALRRVCVVAADGRLVEQSFRVQGLPTAIGVLGSRIFVGNELDRRVDVYTRTGEWLGVLGGPGTEVGDPRDLAVDEDLQRVFVVDGLAREVKVFDATTLTGSLLATLGQPGSQSHEFQNPTGIALDPLGQRVFVAEYGVMDAGAQPRVVILGYDGASLGTLQGDGGPTGQYFARPQGLLLGASGHLFVVDSWRGEVVVMDLASGTQVGVLGGYGKQPGQLLLPLDLVVGGPDGDLFVTSASNRRVERFPAGGTL